MRELARAEIKRDMILLELGSADELLAHMLPVLREAFRRGGTGKRYLATWVRPLYCAVPQGPPTSGARTPPASRRRAQGHKVFSETELPLLFGLLGASRLLTQHYDRYLPVGLPLILRVGWVLFDHARPQPLPLVPLRRLRDHRAGSVSELDAHLRVRSKV